MNINSTEGEKFSLGTKFLTQFSEDGKRWRSVTRVQVRQLLKKGSLFLDSHSTARLQGRKIYRRAWMANYSSLHSQVQIGCKLFSGDAVNTIVKWAKKK